MIVPEAFPFVLEFLTHVSLCVRKIDPDFKLTWLQKTWLSFCIIGIIVTQSLCWQRFENYSLGRYTVASLSWMLRRSKIKWDVLLQGSILAILKKYGITSGHLESDDSDHQRSKSTEKISFVHKIFDKKTNGYFMGQSLVFLILVTNKITIPVGFRFYAPDPKMTEWKKNDQKLRKNKIPKSKRPKLPKKNPNFPTKIELTIQMLKDFKKNFPDIKIQSISADAAYGSADFFKKANKIFPNVQVISQLKNNQKVHFRNKIISVSQLFKQLPSIKKEVSLRGVIQTVEIASARIKVESHGRVLFVIALKYEGENEFRYIIASDLSWRAVDIVRAYSLRWLIEVFFFDWKMYEGWGQLALQQGDEGACRGVLLSLLVDHCLLFHPEQSARIENKIPAVTVGSLKEKLKNESLLA